MVDLLTELVDRGQDVVVFYVPEDSGWRPADPLIHAASEFVTGFLRWLIAADVDEEQIARSRFMKVRLDLNCACVLPEELDGNEHVDETLSVFGVPSAELGTRDGHTSSSLLLTHPSLKEESADVLAARMLSSIAGGAHIDLAFAFAFNLVLSRRPYLTHRVARLAAQLIADRCAVSVKDASAAIVRSMEQAEVARETHFIEIGPAIRRVSEATKESAKARALFALYEIVSEGPLRQAGAVVLELATGTTDKPMLAELRERLVAIGSPLSLMFAECVEPSWRNAAAHQSLRYDAVRRAVVFEDGEAALDEVAERADRTLALLNAFEIGVFAARERDARLGQAIDATGVSKRPPFRDRPMRLAFGARGFAVRDTERTADEVRVWLDPFELGADWTHLIWAMLVVHSFDPDGGTWRIFGDPAAPDGYVVSREATALSLELAGVLEPGVAVSSTAFVPVLASFCAGASAFPSTPLIGQALDLPLRLFRELGRRGLSDLSAAEMALEFGLAGRGLDFAGRLLSDERMLQVALEASEIAAALANPDDLALATSRVERLASLYAVG
jgi:hypothetical protein